MKHLSIIEIAKLTNIINKLGVKRTADKDTAIRKFNAAVEERNQNTPTVIPDGWAIGLTFSEAAEKLIGILEGKKQTMAKKEKKVRAKPNGGGGRPGMRDKKLFPVTEENPFPRDGQSKETFAAIMNTPGKTFRQYVDQGLRANTIAHAIRNQWLRLED